MKRVSTTVLALVGGRDEEQRRELVQDLARGANVRAFLAEPELDALQRAVDAWRSAATAHVPYLVHDADPLAAVTAAWVALFDQAGAPGELEVAVAGTVQRWRAGSLELPDYYLVLDPEDLGVTQRHWYLGVLHGTSPHRVVPVEAYPEAVAWAVRRLRAGRWWPDVPALLDGIERRVPDRLHGPDAGAAPRPVSDDDAGSLLR